MTFNQQLVLAVEARKWTSLDLAAYRLHRIAGRGSRCTASCPNGKILALSMSDSFVQGLRRFQPERGKVFVGIRAKLMHLPALLIVLICFSTVVAAKTFVVDPNGVEGLVGNDSSETIYVKTVGDGIRRLEEADRLVIAPGVYRESILLGTREWTGNRQTIIEATGNGDVIVKGSDVVKGWEKIGDGLFVHRNWKINSQQVFLDGKPLLQVDGVILKGYPTSKDHWIHRITKGKKEKDIWPGRVSGDKRHLPPHSFYYDIASRELYLKVERADSLDGHTIEVSVRPTLVGGAGLNGLVLRNLRFEHSNTSAVRRGGALHVKGNNMLIENVHIYRADAIGLALIGNDNIVRNSSANYCGQLGMSARGARARLINNETSKNNTRGFKIEWEAGGAKFIGNGGLRDSKVIGHLAIRNAGDGIWFDNGNHNNEIRECTLAHNEGHGLHYEVSNAALIENNFIYANQKRGVYLRESFNSQVSYNLIAQNQLEGITAVTKGQAGTGLSVFGNVLAWNGLKRNRIVLIMPKAKGKIDDYSDYNLYITEQAPAGFSLGWPGGLRGVSRGIGAWFAKSGMDEHSWEYKLPRSLAKSSRSGTQSENSDWSEVMSLAGRLRVNIKELKGLVRRHDGRNSLHPGPWKR